MLIRNRNLTGRWGGVIRRGSEVGIALAGSAASPTGYGVWDLEPESASNQRRYLDFHITRTHRIAEKDKGWNLHPHGPSAATSHRGKYGLPPSLFDGDCRVTAETDDRYRVRKRMNQLLNICMEGRIL